MQNRVIFVCIIAFLLIGGLYFLSDFPPFFKSKSASDNHLRYAPYIAIQGEDYLDMVRRGARVGDQVQDFILVTASGRKIEPILMNEKSLIFFGTPGSDDLKIFLPLLKDWARTYVRDLRVYVVFKTQPSEEEITSLQSAGIEVAVNFEEVKKGLDPGRGSCSYLIDEHGTIVYRFKFETFKWKELTQIIDQFARKSSVPPFQGDRLLKLGTPLMLPDMLDATGRWFKLREFQGKPTVLYLVNPFSETCKLSFPLIHRLWEAYDGIVNIAVIFSYYDYYTDQGVKDYYYRYGIEKDTYKSEHVVNPRKMVAENGLEEIRTYFDQNRTIFNYSNFWVIPTIIILDKNLKLAQIMGITTSPGVDPRDLNDQIEKVLLELF